MDGPMKIPTTASGTCETSYWTALKPPCRPAALKPMSNWLFGSGLTPLGLNFGRVPDRALISRYAVDRRVHTFFGFFSPLFFLLLL